VKRIPRIGDGNANEGEGVAQILANFERSRERLQREREDLSPLGNRRFVAAGIERAAFFMSASARRAAFARMDERATGAEPRDEKERPEQNGKRGDSANHLANLIRNRDEVNSLLLFCFGG